MGLTDRKSSMRAAWTLRRSRNSCAAAISGSWKSFVTVNCVANASSALAFQSRSPQPALSLRWIGKIGSGMQTVSVASDAISSPACAACRSGGGRPWSVMHPRSVATVPPRSLIVSSACSGRTQPSSRCSSKLCRPDHSRTAQCRARRQGTSVSSDESDFNPVSRGISLQVAILCKCFGEART